jgi:oxygen-independent coproporphyrinogen-3 oxidase
LKYWKLEPYAGFGADAHSFDGRVRHQNPESVEEYLRSAADTKAQSAASVLPDERFFVGLRLMEGIRPTAEEWGRYDGPISRFLECGLLEATDGMLRLTNRGVLLSNEVFQEFLTA